MRINESKDFSNVLILYYHGKKIIFPTYSNSLMQRMKHRFLVDIYKFKSYSLDVAEKMRRFTDTGIHVQGVPSRTLPSQIPRLEYIEYAQSKISL